MGRGDGCVFATKKDWLALLLYLAIGVAIAAFYFVLPLNGAGSFNQGPDNAPHLSFIQCFIDSGNYSSLNASYYHGIENNYQDPTGQDGNGSFYPAAWHGVTALAASLTGATAAVAANSSLFLFLAIVLPANVFLLIWHLSRRRTHVVLAGSIVPLAFAAFPWGLLTFGPLYPNFSGFAMVPLVMALFVYPFIYRVSRCTTAKYIIVFVFGLVSLAFLQTNADFTVGVFLAPFLIGQIWHRLKESNYAVLSRLWMRLLLSGAFLIMCGAIWVAVYSLPLMQSTVSYPWQPFASLRQEVVNILLLAYRDNPIQPILAFAVIAGVLYLIKMRENRWLVWTYAVACAMCVVAATCSGGVRSLVIGFWYTDPYRIAAMAAMAAMPLAIYGFYAIGWLSMRVWNKVTSSASLQRTPAKFQAVCMLVIACVVLYYPSFELSGIGVVNTALGNFESKWFDSNNNIGDCVLSHDEQEFLDQVKEVTEDSLVINKPDDGSVFAYGAFDIDVFYKRTGIEAYLTDSKESQLFRNELCDYATNSEVQEAVEATGAKYLLLLDQGEEDDTEGRYWFDHYYVDLWQGMDAVDDETPGFKVVLSEGDMRLYEIEPVE